MVYIKKAIENIIITDSVINYIPTSLTILLNDKILGEYLNQSIDKNYLIMTVPSGDTISLNNNEYIMTIKKDNEVIKRELVLVNDESISTSIIEKSKQKEIINYEKK